MIAKRLSDYTKRPNMNCGFVCQPLIHLSLSLEPRVIPLAAVRKAVGKGTMFGNLLWSTWEGDLVSPRRALPWGAGPGAMRGPGTIPPAVLGRSRTHSPRCQPRSRSPWRRSRDPPHRSPSPTWWRRRHPGRWCCRGAAPQPSPRLCARCCCSSPGWETLCPTSSGAGAPQPPCVPHAAGRVPGTATATTTMPPPAPRRGSSRCPGSEQVAAPGAWHLKENRGAPCSFFFRRKTDRGLAEAAIWCTFSLSYYCPRGGEYFPVHEVMPAAETQRARRNGAAVRVPGKDCVPEQEEKDFHSFHREDSQTTAGSKTFHHHEGNHWKCLSARRQLEPGDVRGLGCEWELRGVGRDPRGSAIPQLQRWPGAGKGRQPSCPRMSQSLSHPSRAVTVREPWAPAALKRGAESIHTPHQTTLGMRLVPCKPCSGGTMVDHHLTSWERISKGVDGGESPWAWPGLAFPGYVFRLDPHMCWGAPVFKN